MGSPCPRPQPRCVPLSPWRPASCPPRPSALWPSGRLLMCKPLGGTQAGHPARFVRRGSELAQREDAGPGQGHGQRKPEGRDPGPHPHRAAPPQASAPSAVGPPAPPWRPPRGGPCARVGACVVQRPSCDFRFVVLVSRVTATEKQWQMAPSECRAEWEAAGFRSFCSLIHKTHSGSAGWAREPEREGRLRAG